MSKHSSSKSNARAILCATAACAIARALPAIAFGTVLFLTLAQPAPAQTTDSGTTIGQSTVIWNDDATPTAITGTGDNDRAWVWDTRAENWYVYDNTTGTITSTGTTFTQHDAVVFGASGTSAGGYVIIDSVLSGTYYGAYGAIAAGGNVYISPQAYTGSGATADGINPGIIIASGSWEFDGGQILSGTSGTNTVATSGIAVTGNSAVQFDRSGTFTNQNINIEDGVAFTLATTPTLTLSMSYFGSYATSLGFTNLLSTATDATSAITTGSGASLTIALTGTETTATYNFIRNRTQNATAGAAINAGGNVTFTGTYLSAYFVNNLTANADTTANAYASAIYSTGTLTVANGAMLRGEGGFAAQQIDITNATLAPTADELSLQQGILTLTVLDDAGAPISATGANAKINFTNVTLYGYGGRLATYLDSEINLTGTLRIDTSSFPSSNNLPNVMTISAPLTGTADLDVTGGQTVLFTSTFNTYTGINTIESGTLVGNIPDSGTLNITSTGAYVSGSLFTFSTTIYPTDTTFTTDPNTNEITGTTIITATDTIATRTPYAAKRTIAELNGAGLLNMSGNDLDLGGGDFSTGTLINVNTLTKINPDTNLSLAGGTVATLDIKEGAITLGFGQQLNVTGTATIDPTGTLNLTLSNIAALNAQTLVTNGAALNITGFGNLTQDPVSTQTNTLITTATPITRDYTINYLGTPLADLQPSEDRFIDLAEDPAETPNQISVTTSLVWTNTTTGYAHGTFDIPNGIVTINADLADNPYAAGGAGYHGWDGTTLTKTGTGTLILNGANTYTGNTSIDAGTLVNNNLISSPTVTVSATATLVNYGTITGQTDNAGYLYTTSTATIGDIYNTGTVQFYIYNSNTLNISTTDTIDSSSGTDVTTTATITTIDPFTYNYDGVLSGPGDLIKTGNQTLVLSGSNTNSGNVLIISGTLQSGRAHNLDAAASYTLDNQLDTSDTTATIGATGTATLDLGGYDQNLKALYYTDNGGILNFGPVATATTPITNYAIVTIGTLAATGTIGRNNVIMMRSDYGANQADQLVITSTVSGTYRVIISNTDSVRASKLTSIPLIVTPAGTGTATTITGTDATGAVTTAYTTVFSGSAESGIGILSLHTGDGGSISPDPDTWYLARTNKLSNTADAIFATISVSALEWLYQLDLVRQRMGDLRQEALMRPPSRKLSPLTYTTVTSDGGNAWIRANAYHLDATDKITGEEFSENVGNVALGLDKTYRWEQHQYLLGGFANMGTVSRDFSANVSAADRDPQKRGDGKTNDLALGLYFTYLNDNGWYGDTVFKIARDHNSFTANAIDGFVNTGDYNAVTWGLTQEVGKIVRNRKTGWWYEPSGQLALIHFNGVNYTTNNDINVDISSGFFQQYRAGIRAGYDKTKFPLKPYARLGLAYTMGSSPTVHIEDMDFSPIIHGFRYEAGIGLSFVIDDKSQLYLDYEYAKAREYTRPWSVNFGYRHTW